LAIWKLSQKWWLPATHEAKLRGSLSSGVQGSHPVNKKERKILECRQLIVAFDDITKKSIDAVHHLQCNCYSCRETFVFIVWSLESSH
jgi:hypothetical protein